MDKKKILVIEDDVMMQRIFERLLPEKYEVTVQKEFTDVLSDLRAMAEKPDLIILDLMMPQVGGLEILATLSADEAWKSVPVIVVTNMGGEESGKKALALGAKRYLIKSEHDPKELISIIEELLPPA
jgi:CheY-like chemotaxis protein